MVSIKGKWGEVQKSEAKATKGEKRKRKYFLEKQTKKETRLTLCANPSVVMYRDTRTGLAPEIVVFDRTPRQPAGGGGHGGEERNVYGELKHKSMRIKPADAHSLLRPETTESLFLLWRVTADEKYRRWGLDIFRAMQRFARLPGGIDGDGVAPGYASVANVNENVQYDPRRAGADAVGGVRHKDKMECEYLGGGKGGA